jgi:hypothetical protein
MRTVDGVEQGEVKARVLVSSRRARDTRPRARRKYQHIIKGRNSALAPLPYWATHHLCELHSKKLLSSQSTRNNYVTQI